jgi:hypothetical protein
MSASEVLAGEVLTKAVTGASAYDEMQINSHDMNMVKCSHIHGIQ